MSKRALLIGSATGGLRGCATDLERMTELLGPGGHGFDLLRCAGEDATRAGILQAYGSLIEAAGVDDTVLVYYSGHGARVVNEGAAGASGEPAYYQSLVPFDFARTSGEDFRGILALELSHLLGRLTQKTRNVTVILDCCHSQRMSRDARAGQARAQKRPLVVSIERHLDELKARGFRRTALESNPHAVRLVACGLLESAWEYECDDGRTGGILTESFVKAAMEKGAEGATWAELGRWIRERVLRVFPAQRPEVEGPVQRLLFSTSERAASAPLAVTNREGVPYLQAGALRDVRRGDVYELRGGEAKPGTRLLAVRVGSAESMLRPLTPLAELPADASACLVERSASRVPIALEGAVRDALARAVVEHPLTRVAEPGEPAVARLALEDGRLALRDSAGDLLAWPRPLAEAAVELGANLCSIARAHALRSLQSPRAASFGEDAFSVTWGVVEDGKERELPLSGASVEAGASIFVRLRNLAKRPLYATVLDVGVSQSVSLLSASSPSGVPIEPGQSYTLGEDDFGELTGWPVYWPASVPDESARHPDVPGREESFVVLVTDAPQDLRPLETGGVREGPGDRREPSDLERELGQVFRGGSREVRPSGPPVSHRVRHIDFFLRP